MLICEPVNDKSGNLDAGLCDPLSAEAVSGYTRGQRL